MPHVETTLVEESDDRLAKVEEAKRTGNAFQSVGTRGSEIVPTEIAIAIAEEKSKQDTTVFHGRPIAAHRENFMVQREEDPEFLPRTNEEKAEAHHAYSAELVRQQNEQKKIDAERADQGYDFAAAKREENERLAEAYRNEMIAWSNQRREKLAGGPTALQVVDQIVEHLDVAQLANEPLEVRVAAYSDHVNIPDALEKPAEEALTIKDAIISTEIGFREHAEGGTATDFAQREAQVEEVASEEVVAPETLAEAQAEEAEAEVEDEAPRSRRSSKKESA